MGHRMVTLLYCIYPGVTVLPIGRPDGTGAITYQRVFCQYSANTSSRQDFPRCCLTPYYYLQRLRKP